MILEMIEICKFSNIKEKELNKIFCTIYKSSFNVHVTHALHAITVLRNGRKINFNSMVTLNRKQLMYFFFL